MKDPIQSRANKEEFVRAGPWDRKELVYPNLVLSQK